MKRPKWLDRSLVIGPYFTLCTSNQQFQRELKNLGVEEGLQFLGKGAAATTYELEARDGYTCCIVCIEPRKRSAASLAGIMAHEAAHIWQRHEEDIGEQEASAEFEAYAIQNLTERLFEEYERQTEGHNK